MHKATPHLQFARKFAKLLDNQFSFFGISVGLDPILGLIPGLGDLLSLFFSFYLIWIGIQLELPKHRLGQMILNVFVDTFIGVIPFIGDIADFFFHSNLNNLAILEKHHHEHELKNSYIEDGEVISRAR